MHTKNLYAANANSASSMAGDYVDQGAQALSRTKDDLMKEFENLVSAGETLLKSTSSLSTGALADAREAFSVALSDAQTQYNKLSKAAQAKTREAATAADDYVHANPWPAIGIAAGIAFVVGAVSMRR